jgi:N-methylhydantoinase A/oxoprolinase/acetone carboxylase beta subunit
MDIGGTFTDIAVQIGSRFVTIRVPATLPAEAKVSPDDAKSFAVLKRRSS